MKNDECTIYIVTKHGYTQRYRKEKNCWTQTCPNGKVRLLTAEQLLSHILPPLAGISPATVGVEPDKQAKENDKIQSANYIPHDLIKKHKRLKSIRAEV